ncbi:alpha-(1,3)-fucosyltransferase B [Episyrphus balteatus]|uniref:alpha-(1,3)-fucosyltransferase B n=1 Tax=Episyrphus balteatus TaxID=286459 RepID=UPI002486632B|nr:alpha-(1,3)-fucosyltransferase B [Episyrphus balteatus]
MRLFAKIKLFLSIILIVLGITLAFWLWKDNGTNEIPSRRTSRNGPATSPPVILWWTKLLPKYHQTKRCGFNQCTFTVDRNLLNNNNTKVLVFYGSDLNKTDLPLPRQPHHLWALFHEESPKNVPFIQSAKILKHFNITSTFSRHSNFPLTTQFIQSEKELTDRKYLVAIGTKSLLRETENLAPVAFVQSICDTASGRNEYIKELMKYIDIDSYGKCLHNKDLPKELTGDYLNTIQSEEFYRFFARYKFIIAYENGVCKDYISEKFWRPLIMGNIPIYFGSPTIKDWEPTKKSVIYISDFASPKALAEYLKRLDANDHEYNTYLDHKYSMLHSVTNDLLKATLLERDFESDNQFELFECFICNRIHDDNFHSIADVGHYDCGGDGDTNNRLQYPAMETSMKHSDWPSIMSMGKCEAGVLDALLQRNTNFTELEFADMLQQDIKTTKCRL